MAREDMMIPGRTLSEEEHVALMDRILPAAEEVREILAKMRPKESQVANAMELAITRAVGHVLSEVCCDYIIEHMAKLIPAAVDKAIQGEWESYVSGSKVRDNLQRLVVRKLEEVVQRDIAARYKVDIKVSFSEVERK